MGLNCTYSSRKRVIINLVAIATLPSNSTPEFRTMKRSCVVCGKKLEIKVFKDRKYTGGHYFGKILEGEKDEFEYWECDNCYAGN